MRFIVFKGLNMRLRPACDYLVYLIVRFLVCFVQALPLALCHRTSQVLAVLACDVFRIRSDVVDENLRHAFPDWTPQQRRRAARGMWEHLLLLICEMTQVPRKIHDTNWHRHVRLTNIEAMVATLLERRPKVVLTGHFGNFEVGGYMCALLGFPTHTVVRPLDNPYLDRFLARFRLASGQRILPKQGSAPQVQELLENNGVLGLLGDQAAGPKGCSADFFGRQIFCHKAIALFALVNKAPLLVTTTRRTDGPMQFEITLEEQYDPSNPNQDLGNAKDVTQWYCRLLEEAIRKRPQQYWWVHRLWKEKLVRWKGKWRPASKVPGADELAVPDSEEAATVVRLPKSAEPGKRRKTA
jgi:KDO2-lipid IV(A) lauroyltransferase